LRQADFSDAAFVRSLSKQAFARYGPYEKLLPEWLLSGMTVTLIAWLGKKPIGFVMMGRPLHNGWSPEVSEILAIAVERSRQGAGIGDRLLAEALARAGSLGIETLALHTSLDNKPAQGLFEKHGFQPAEIKPRFYPEGQDALLMERTLP
jgi:ribosomal protein S18 acetylase RimI-like enzyme